MEDVSSFFNITHNTTKINNTNIRKYKKIISQLTQKGIINLLEFGFLIEFARSNGSLVNINWFLDIVKKANHEEFTELINDMFSNIVTNYDKTNLITNMQKNKKDLKFTEDQIINMTNILDFIVDYKQKEYGSYGSAGVGKTTVIVEFMYYLLYNGLVKSIAFTALTHKAINVIKSKFFPYLKDLANKLLNISKDTLHTMSVEDILDKFYDNKIKIEFITIHRLLKYKTDFNLEGDRIFIRDDKKVSGIKNYELVIIDECSMISDDIASNLSKEIENESNNTGDNYKKVSKLLYCGDSCQINPVNEEISMIFNRNNFKSYTMKQIVRTNNNNIIGLCNNVRQWIQKEVLKPTPKLFEGDGVYHYKLEKNQKKTDTIWFKKYIEFIKKDIYTSNIILTWTNRQTDDYNEQARKILYSHKEIIQEYEIGDILMFKDYYSITNQNSNQTKNKFEMKDMFYTSDQIRITDANLISKIQDEFNLTMINYDKLKTKLKNINVIDTKYKNIIKNINKYTKRSYQLWHLYIQKLSEHINHGNSINKIPKTYEIFVISNASKDIYLKEKNLISQEITKLRKILYLEVHADDQDLIDRFVIKPLLKEWNKIMIEPFAHVNMSMAGTVHTSQGSTFCNVFVDVKDILSNPNTEEARRCLYTAYTRAANSVHILY
jgi:hypothetical protein